MKLYYYDIRVPLSAEELALVAPERIERARRYFKAEDRARCLAAGVLLSRALGVTSEGALVYGRFGKPALKRGFPFFSVSHSGDFAVLAVANDPIGVDIERVQPYSKETARACLTPPELEWLGAQRSDAAFFRLWTAKEAIMKATGEGLSLDPAAFSVLPIENGQHTAASGVWHIYWLSLENHVLCAASAEPDAPVLISISESP